MSTEDATPRLDAHVHVWDLAELDQPWTVGLPRLRRSFALTELEPELRRHRLSGAIVVQTVCVPEETPALLALAAGRAEVAGVVGWVDLAAADVAERLQALQLLDPVGALVGVRHQIQQEPGSSWFRDEAVGRGLDAVAAAGLTYDLVVRSDQLTATIDLVRSRPDLRFVLDHGGNPKIGADGFDQWHSAITQLARSANVAVKLSGLGSQTDPPSWPTEQLKPYVAALFAAFGAERVMYGSDWPVCLLAGSYAEMFRAAIELTDELTGYERAQVFGGSAARWYVIEP